jgi:hypothetical protein
MKIDRRFILAQKTILAIGLFVLLGLICMPAIAADRFVNNEDGTVTDTETGLMWAAKDNGDPINWQGAGTYCLNYSGGGHTDWRMPTLAELASLYDPDVKNKHGYHLTNHIDTSAESCWSSDTRGFEAARYNFTYGQEYWLRQSYSGPSRVLPVRDSN